MEEDTKKKILTITMVACLGLAAVITFATGGFFKGGPKVRASDTMTLLCVNPECGGDSEITREEYRESMENSGVGGMGPMAMMGPTPVECPECGEMSATIALRCKECEHVFIQQMGSDDYPDRCPECEYSDIENRRDN